MDPTDLPALLRQMNIDINDTQIAQRALASRSSQDAGRRRRSPPSYRHGMSEEEMKQYFKEYKEWFEEDRSIPPEPAPHIDREALINEQIRRRTDLEVRARTSSQGIQFFITIVGFAKHSSSTPVSNLKPIRFAEMLVRRVHVGRYLLCRIVAPCSRMVAVQTIVEDVDGVVYDLSIYNFPTTVDCTQEHVDAMFPVGAILAIREPTFKAPTQGDRPLVRIDSPTDITFVVSGSPLLQGVTWKTGTSVARSTELPATLDAWQSCGNNYFKLSQWFLAASAYSRGLALNPAAVVLLLNRAEAYLRLGYYSGALCDARRVLTTEGTPDAHVGKALFRLAKAQYGKGEYEAAENSFQRWKDAHAGDKSADTWIDRCRARTKEHKSGQYNWVSLFHTAKQKIRLDVAHYAGPMQVSQMAHRGGGRGVLATRDLTVGDLLMVTKPFASVYASDLPRDKFVVMLDLISSTSRERTDALLLPRIVERIYGNPDLRDTVYHLYAGPDYPQPPGIYPPQSSEPIPVEPLEPKVDIDIAQLEAICTYNNFGLYPLASLFNHSCAPNAVWYCIGDIMFIRASGPITAGTEITLPYSVEESYIDRQNALKKHMLEHCMCWLCEEDRKDGDKRLRRRHELKGKLVTRDILSAPLAEVRKLETDIRDTYSPTRGPVRPLSALALHTIAEKLRNTGNQRQLREALTVDMEALRCLGFEVLQGSPGPAGLPIGTDSFPSVTSFFEPVAMMLRIACTYLNLKDDTNAVPWMRAALWLTDMSVGGGKALFILVHEETLKQMRILDLAAQLL